MAVKKRVHTKMLVDKLHTLVRANADLDFVKTIVTGDLSQLPSMNQMENAQFIEEFFPALFICPLETEVSRATADKKNHAIDQTFEFRYIRYNSQTSEINEQEASIEETDIVADTLIEDEDLNISERYQMILNNGNIIGHILQTELLYIDYKPEELEVLEALNLDLILTRFEYCITYKSYNK